MKIDTDRIYAGFFGQISDGGVHDLNIMDADIVSRIVGSGKAGDVGGITGFATGDSNNICKIERCGFTGNISGGYYTGGIAGTCQTDAIEDCFAIGNISGKYFTAGIVASGNAVNSYFSGSVTGYANVSAISCRYGNMNDNCYYNADGVNNFRGGSYISIDEMRTDRFKNMLSSNWERSELVNNGFPVPYPLANSRVTTNLARLNSNADIEFCGLYIQGVDRNYQTRGFQWYSKSGEAPIINEMISSSSDAFFSQVIPNTLISKEGINFRAFAFENNDSIYGEWKSFLPDISLPKPLLYKSSWQDNGTMTLSYSIINDDKLEIESAILHYGISGGGTENFERISLDINAQDIELSNLDKNRSYAAYIKVKTKDGYVSESPLYEFSFLQTGTATMIDTEEIVDIYTIEGLPCGLSTTISEFSKTNESGIYIVNGKKLYIRHK